MTKGTTYKRMMRRRAMGLVVKREVAEEFGLRPEELGRNDQPGDAITASASVEKAQAKTGRQPPLLRLSARGAGMGADVPLLSRTTALLCALASLPKPRRRGIFVAPWGLQLLPRTLKKAWGAKTAATASPSSAGPETGVWESAAAANIDPDQS